jgi:hypothetical protein
MRHLFNVGLKSLRQMRHLFNVGNALNRRLAFVDCGAMSNPA